MAYTFYVYDEGHIKEVLQEQVEEVDHRYLEVTDERGLMMRHKLLEKFQDYKNKWVIYKVGKPVDYKNPPTQRNVFEGVDHGGDREENPHRAHVTDLGGLYEHWPHRV